jgi:hypothetical protein
MTPRQRARARRADLRRAWRVLSRQLASLDPAVYRPAIDAQARLFRAMRGRRRLPFEVWPYLRLQSRIAALNRAAELRRARPFGSWRDAHADAMQTVRIWRVSPNDYRGLPQ